MRTIHLYALVSIISLPLLGISLHIKDTRYKMIGRNYKCLLCSMRIIHGHVHSRNCGGAAMLISCMAEILIIAALWLHCQCMSFLHDMWSPWHVMHDSQTALVEHKADTICTCSRLGDFAKQKFFLNPS